MSLSDRKVGRGLFVFTFVFVLVLVLVIEKAIEDEGESRTPGFRFWELFENFEAASAIGLEDCR